MCKGQVLDDVSVDKFVRPDSAECYPSHWVSITESEAVSGMAWVPCGQGSFEIKTSGQDECKGTWTAPPDTLYPNTDVDLNLHAEWVFDSEILHSGCSVYLNNWSKPYIKMSGRLDEISSPQTQDVKRTLSIPGGYEGQKYGINFGIQGPGGSGDVNFIYKYQNQVPPGDKCSLPQVCPWDISKSPPFIETYQIGQNIEFSIAAGVDTWIASHSECSTGEQNTYWNFGDGKTSAGLDNKTVKHAYEYEDKFSVRAVFQFTFPNPVTHPTAECYVDTSVNVMGGGPDLVITSVSSPTSGTAGGMINVEAFVKNQGTLEADSFRLQFLFSPDNIITLADIDTGYGCTVPTLAPGASYKCFGSIKIPANTPNGTYFLGAYADYFEKIPETIEFNNGLAAPNPIEIDGGGGGPLADLLPLSVTSPAVGVAGGMIDASALVKNQGLSHAGVFRLGYYFSKDKAITLSDIDTGYGCNFPYLAKGASTTCSGKVKIPASTPEGMHYLGAFADIGQIIPESSEVNNGLAATNTINIYHSIFADVLPTGWAYKYIKAIRDAGITGGCGNGNYCPTSFVTREQMAAFLVRAVEGEPAKDYCGYFTPFSDVSWSQWSCPYIKRLAEKNITSGCGNGYYCPLHLVTREQMAVFIVRSLEGDPWSNYCQGLRPFNDVPANAWSCGHIKRLEELGITQGCGNGNYCPSKFLTREEMAAFLARAFLGMD